MQTKNKHKTNTTNSSQTFFAWCYLVWAVQPIWFEKSTNRKKTNEIQKGTYHNKKAKESKQIQKENQKKQRKHIS